MKYENLDWINSLRVLATFSVIVLHVAADILYQYGSISNSDWWTGNIFDSSVRFCVPIFLMISGTLIFSKTYESTGEYLRKRVLRILFPFLFWSIIYIAVGLLVKFNSGEYLSFKEALKYVFVKLRDGASFHLWYIYMITNKINKKLYIGQTIRSELNCRWREHKLCKKDCIGNYLYNAYKKYGINNNICNIANLFK